MQPDRKQRLSRYESLDEKIKPLYDAPESGHLLRTVFEKYLTNMAFYDNYVDLVGDCILGFHKTTELPKLFQERLMIGADQAQRMTADLMDFLAPIVEREQAENNIKKAEAHKLADEIATIPKDAPSDTVTEAPAVKPMRTMADDMNRVHGYGAYREANPLSDDNSTDEPVIKAHPQEDILSGNLKPIADLPKYHEPEQGTEAPTNQPQEKQTEVAQSNRIPIQPA